MTRPWKLQGRHRKSRTPAMSSRRDTAPWAGSGRTHIHAFKSTHVPSLSHPPESVLPLGMPGIVQWAKQSVERQPLPLHPAPPEPAVSHGSLCVDLSEAGPPFLGGLWEGLGILPGRQELLPEWDCLTGTGRGTAHPSWCGQPCAGPLCGSVCHFPPEFVRASVSACKRAAARVAK